MKTKISIFIIIVCLLLSGCNMNTKNKIVESNKEASQSSENTDTENTTVKEEVYSLMTVNEFREFYSITEEQLTDY